MKVLITGSRNWENHDSIRKELSSFSKDTIFVHGNCQTGADKIADGILVNELSIQDDNIHRYSADWNFGRAAGPIRNKLMVESELPIDICLAFSEDISKSKGTANCIAIARKYDIEVKLIKG